MAAANDYDVAIVGGGMVGVSLALALSRALPGKARVLLVESYPLPQPSQDFSTSYSPSFDARSTALSYASCLIYQQLGVWQQLQERACAIASIHVSDQGRFGSALLQAADYEWPALGYVIENAWLGNVLIQCLHERGEVQLLSPTKVVGVVVGATGVELQFAEGGGSRCQLLVVADGADSALRDSLGIGVEETPYSQHALIANIGHALPHRGRAYERFTRQGPLACLPLPAVAASGNAVTTTGDAKRSALVWTMPEAEAAQLQVCPEFEFLERLQQRFGYRLGRMHTVGERHIYPLSLVRAQEQVRSRLVVIGNAAHALHPVAGQGFNLALRDVAKLVAVLTDAEAAGEDIFELQCLRRYLDGQRADQELTVTFSDRLPGLFMHRDPALGLLRDIGLFGLDMSPGLKREFVQQTAGTQASAEYRNVHP